MGNAYGTQGYPAVGGGMPGLPVRASGGFDLDIDWVVSGYSVDVAGVTVPTPNAIKPGQLFVTASVINNGSQYGAFATLSNYIVCSPHTLYCAPAPGGVTNVAGMYVSFSDSQIQIGGLNLANQCHLRAMQVKNKVKSRQSVQLASTGVIADTALAIPLTNPKKVFYSVYSTGFSTNGNMAYCGQLFQFADVAVSPFSCEQSGAHYSGAFGFPDGNTVRRYRGYASGGSSTLWIVEFE
ncbi:hypothetical protein ACFQUU_27115 [Herbaspirillum sp. GCM10030257]|uniref:hypothetical protein n=1 Tax=Herbaspirillum sp. GCM10030257 TaxID=3273393 RepID=UPI003620D543